jgi:hypothetical protein
LRAANSLAKAAPIPEDAPVMKAVFLVFSIRVAAFVKNCNASDRVVLISKIDLNGQG